MALERDLFRRQFLMTPGACASLAHWPSAPFGEYRIYAHPDVGLRVVESEGSACAAALIGYMIDPDYPRRSDLEVLRDLLACVASSGDVSRHLRSMAGRFVLVFRDSQDTYVFHDPCGLRSVFYSRHKGRVHVGSQPLIFAHVMPLTEGPRFNAYRASDYARTLEDWLPCGLSLYEDIDQLIPNHCLRLSTCRQERYWPELPLQERLLDEVVPEASRLLQNLMTAANGRFEPALGLTAGMDTRVLLAACRNTAARTHFYTLQFRNLGPQSNDIRIPQTLLQSLGYAHHVIDCRGPVEPGFADLYRRNAAMAHLNDWGQIAYGMVRSYPRGRLSVKGNCGEIARCFYYKSGRHEPVESVDDLVDLEPGWVTLPFVRDHLFGWLSEALAVEAETGVDVLDLFYWEHRMGGWQAQSQLEWDLVQGAFTPFNHRGLLEMLLGVPARLRCAPDYVLFRRICEHLWPEIMSHPINPPETVKGMLKEAMLRLGLHGVAAGVRKALRPRGSGRRSSRAKGPGG